MKKTSRRRIDVNVEELDRIIDSGMSAPLSEADGQKLKTALHAMIEKLRPQAKTEKTSSVFGESNGVAAEAEASRQQPAGHGRNGADAYRAAEKIRVANAKLAHGDRSPDCARGNVYSQKEPKALSRNTPKLTGGVQYSAGQLSGAGEDSALCPGQLRTGRTAPTPPKTGHGN